MSLNTNASIDSHVRSVAWLHIALGILTLMGALCIFLIFGALGAVGATASNSKDALPTIALFGGIGTFMFMLIAIFALPHLLVGWGLLNGASWARILGIVVSILSLIHPSMGIGTALGIYSLVILFDRKVAARFP